jgi:hypothetical protein
MADDSSSLSTWPTAAFFLGAWIWAWQARIRVDDFFSKIDFGCQSATSDTKKRLFSYW